jgi:hypothetical protein
LIKSEAIIAVNSGKLVKHISFAEDKYLALEYIQRYKKDLNNPKKLIKDYLEKIISIGSNFKYNFDKYWSFKDIIPYIMIIGQLLIN